MELTRRNTNRSAQTQHSSPLTTIILALLFVGWVGEWPLEIDTFLYSGLWRSPFGVFGPLFVPMPGVSLSPWQVMLIALAPFCLGTTSVGSPRQHAPEMDRAILVSMTCIGITFLWGMVRGGSPWAAYFQLWRFLTALLVAYMLMSVLRTPRDLAKLGKLVVLVALIRATLCVYFYWAYLHDKPPPVPDYVTNHDDSILFVAAILITTTWAAIKGGKATRTKAALIVLFIFYAVVLNDRRIAWVELALATPLFYILIGPGPVRSRINRWAIAASPLAIVYTVAGLASNHPIFAPIHAFSSAGSDYDPSSLTRQEEIRNLLYTLVESGNPLLGVGWGMPYDLVESYWSNYGGWDLFLYTPHNSLLGLGAYAGLVGIIGIWGVLATGTYLAARGYRNSTDPVVRTAGVASIGAIAAYSVHCYGDVGLQSLAANLLFGAALATAGKIAAWGEYLSPAPAVTSPAGDTRPTLEPQRPRRKTGAFGTAFAPSAQAPSTRRTDVAPKPNRALTRSTRR